MIAIRHETAFDVARREALLDAALGDPPTPAHPVAWFGRLVRLLEACAPTQRDWRRRYGIASAHSTHLAQDP